MNDKRFELLSTEYEREQAELEQSIATLQAGLDGYNVDSMRQENEAASQGDGVIFEDIHLLLTRTHGNSPTLPQIPWACRRFG